MAWSAALFVRSTDREAGLRGPLARSSGSEVAAGTVLQADEVRVG